MNSIDLLMSQWSRVGFRFSTRPSKNSVDIEPLIINSIESGEDEPRLLWGCLTWVTCFSDLINIQRILKYKNTGNQALLGCIFNIALENGADRRLKNVVKNCTPDKRKRVLFSKTLGSKVYDKIAKEDGLDIFKNWGFYCASYDVKKDALNTRDFILKKNKNLAIRAAFGVNVRSEIISFLLEKPKAYINQISKAIGFSYQPVYHEIQMLLMNNFLQCETLGNLKIVSLRSQTLKFLKYLPVE